MPCLVETFKPRTYPYSVERMTVVPKPRELHVFAVRLRIKGTLRFVGYPISAPSVGCTTALVF